MLAVRTTAIIIASIIALIALTIPSNTDVVIEQHVFYPHEVSNIGYRYDASHNTTYMTGVYKGCEVYVEGYEMPTYADYEAAWLDLYPNYHGENNEIIKAWYGGSIPSSWFGYYEKPFKWDIPELASHYYELHPERVEVEGYGI